MQKPIVALGAIVLVLSVSAQPPGGGPPGGGFGRQNFGQRYTGPLTNYVSMTTNGAYRVIQANGIPDHPPGQFPNAHNPNSISPQRYYYKVPLHPRIAVQETKLRMQPFGIAVNGVVFDPGAAEWWNRDQSSGWQYEPFNMPGKLGLDEYNAHVQPNGAYHYHAIPAGLMTKLGGQSKMVILGWAADGFPMYGPMCSADAKNPQSRLKKMTSSYRVKKGARNGAPGGNYDGTFLADFEYIKGAGDLDECNGRFGPTPDFPAGTYYYVLTEDYPFVPRIFKGMPDASFERRGPPGGFGGRGPGQGQGRQQGPPGEGRNGPPQGQQGGFDQGRDGGPQGRGNTGRNGPPPSQGQQGFDRNQQGGNPPGPPQDNQ